MNGAQPAVVQLLGRLPNDGRFERPLAALSENPLIAMEPR
jgi:hypothetical protein